MYEIEKLVKDGKSIREISRELGIPKSTIQDRIRELGLKTIYKEYNETIRRNLDKPLNTITKEEYLKNLNSLTTIDVTSLSPNPRRLRNRKRDIGYSAISIIQNSKPSYFIMLKKSVQEIKTQDILKVLKILNIKIDMDKVVTDKRIRLNKNFGFWSCSVMLNEKYHGLKLKVYAKLSKLENPTTEDLIQIYHEVFSEHFIVLNLTHLQI